MKRIKKTARRALQKGGLLAGVSSMAIIGVYTGMKRDCEAKDVFCEFCEEMCEDAPNKRSVAIWRGVAALMAVSHALGHYARDGWDVRDLRDVMGEFDSAMRTTAAKLV